MPRAPKWRKVLNYNNGGNQTSYKNPRFECRGKIVSAPKSRKNPCIVGWVFAPKKVG